MAWHGVADERCRSSGCSRGSRTLYVWVEDDVVDAEVEGAEALLPRGAGGGEASADGAQEAARGGAGGGGVEAFEHGLGGAVRGVARGRAVREEGVDVLVLARRGRHRIGLETAGGGDGWMVRGECEVGGRRRRVRWKENSGEGAFIGGGGLGRRGDAAGTAVGGRTRLQQGHRDKQVK